MPVTFAKTVGIILVAMMWGGALAAPAGQVTGRGCRVENGAGCLRGVGDAAESAL